MLNQLCTSQALSVDPINGHVIELLNLALESDATKGPTGTDKFPGGTESFEKTMLALRAKYTQFVSKSAGDVRKEGDMSGERSFKSDDEMSVG